jgi:dihydropteroate synthase
VDLYGVINASPDSLHADSIVRTTAEALARAHWLFANGAQHIDLGGQGSTDIASITHPDEEWARLADIVPALASFVRERGGQLSVDSWRPSVMQRALDAGATVINAADGLQEDAMLELAAERQVPVVLPFLSGPDPRHMEHVQGDPVAVLVEWFTAALDRADRFGIRRNIIIDPGTGFAPPSWPWEDRYHYQKRVYSNIGELRRFGLPIYIALPWRETVQHDELLDIVCAQGVDFGRCHYPARVRAAEARVQHRSAQPPAG